MALYRYGLYSYGPIYSDLCTQHFSHDILVIMTYESVLPEQLGRPMHGPDILVVKHCLLLHTSQYFLGGWVVHSNAASAGVLVWQF